MRNTIFVILTAIILTATRLSANEANGLRIFESGKRTDTIARIESIAERILSSPEDSMKIEAYRLLKYGEKHNDNLLMTYGNSLVGFYYLIQDADMADSALFYLNNSLSIAESRTRNDNEHHYRWILARTYNYLGLYFLNYQIDYYKASECFFEALENIDNRSVIYPLVLANLTLVHYFRNDASGMGYARELYDYYKSTGDSPFEANYCMAAMLYTIGDYSEAEKYIDDAISIISKYNTHENQRLIINANNLKGKIMWAKGQVEEALKSMERATELKTDDISADITETYILFSDYFKKLGKTDRALELLLQCQNMHRNDRGLVHQPKLYDKISELYETKGDYRKALEYHKLYLTSQKALFDQKKEYDLGEIKAVYQVERYRNKIKEQEIASLKKNRQIMILSISIVIALLICAVIWYIMYKKNRYYEKIVQQYSQNASLNKRIRELEDQNQKYTKSALSEDKGDDLFERMVNLMEKDKVYHDPNLTIDRLAAILDSNRTYLSRIINERTGMNFSQYVSKHRIDEAISIIMESKGECLLKTLAFDLGFKTTSSFYKAFSKETGMPPSSFREKCMKE